MISVVKIVIAVLLAISVLPWSFWLLFEQWRSSAGLLPPNDRWWFVGGLGLSVPLVLWRKPNALVHTFIHEMCHALLCLVMGVRIKSFAISDGQGGAVGHQQVDPLRGTLISIAPYTLPLLLAVVLGLRMWFTDPSGTRAILSGAAGFFYVHHLHALYYNIKINFWGRQADLVKVTRPLSAVLIAIAWCLTTYWLLWVIY